MLVARLRSDNPLGDAELTYDDGLETFILEGTGEITPARLLDFENRQQLLWVDEACRERTLGIVIARVRGETASSAAARAAAAAGAVAAASPEALGAAPGIPAAPTRSEASAEAAREGGRAVWIEPPVAESQSHEPSGEAPRRARRWWAWAVIPAACMACVAMGFLFPHAIAHQFALSFTRQVTPYTELYFTSPDTLPTRLRVGEANPFGFTVVNHEGRKHTYAYVVTLTGPAGPSVIERGTIALGDNQGANRVVSVAATGRHAAFLITVSLGDPPQAIFFRGHS